MPNHVSMVAKQLDCSHTACANELQLSSRATCGVLARMIWCYCFHCCPHKRDSHSWIGMDCTVHGYRTGLLAAAVAGIRGQRMGVTGNSQMQLDFVKPSQKLPFSMETCPPAMYHTWCQRCHQARHASQNSTTSARAHQRARTMPDDKHVHPPNCIFYTPSMLSLVQVLEASQQVYPY